MLTDGDPRNWPYAIIVLAKARKEQLSSISTILAKENKPEAFIHSNKDRRKDSCTRE